MGIQPDNQVEINNVPFSSLKKVKELFEEILEEVGKSYVTFPA